MELLKSLEQEALSNENVRLQIEIGELSKMVDLMLENAELRCTLTDHESTERSLSPSGQEHKESKATGPTQLQRCQQIVAEICFQLDRRILSFIFLEKNRLYGYTVSNAQEKILQATSCPFTNKVDESQRAEMNRRFMDIMNRLKKYGYDPRVHSIFSEYLVNIYDGIMKDWPLPRTSKLVSYSDPEVMRKMAAEAMPANVLKDVDVLLNCLINLAKEDGKPLFIW